MIRVRSVCSPAVLALITFCIGSVHAQSDAEALETHMRAFRAKVIQKRDSSLRVLLDLTDEQEKTFRPLLKGYDKELKTLDKMDRKLIREFAGVYDNLTAETAADLSKRFFDLRRERLALQEKYLKQISDEVSPATAVLFIQLQRRFEAQLESERMKYSPLAE